MDTIQVFVSFDVERDGDLLDRIQAEAALSRSGFEITAHSTAPTAEDPWSESARRGIRSADQVFFLCGEHSESAPAMGGELRMAQEERKPYLLVWGRREIMCTKPAGARPAESMYSWTSEILRIQMDVMARTTQRTPAAKAALPAGEAD